MAKTVAARKAKGRNLQNDLRDKLLEAFPVLEKDDVVSCPMGVIGTDIKLSPAAKKLIPYAFECKAQEKIAIWQSLQQCETNAGIATPALVFKRNRSKTYVTIDIDTFIKLIKKK
jgi:hypothetical protein